MAKNLIEKGYSLIIFVIIGQAMEEISAMAANKAGYGVNEVAGMVLIQNEDFHFRSMQQMP